MEAGAIKVRKKPKEDTGHLPEKKHPSSPQYLAPKSPLPKVVEHVPSADFKASDTSNLQVGQKVEHQRFGFGEVIKMEGAAHNPIATVKFEHEWRKEDHAELCEAAG